MSSDVTPKNSSASSANDKQVAGTHYKSEFQHWDFVLATKMNYLLGCASKYVSRWRKKNGVEDLEKAKHYLQKALEEKLEVHATGLGLSICRCFIETNKLCQHEGSAIYLMYQGLYKEAIAQVDALLVEAESDATKAYVKQE